MLDATRDGIVSGFRVEIDGEVKQILCVCKKVLSYAGGVSEAGKGLCLYASLNFVCPRSRRGGTSDR